ncbi:MAG: hypothetical protein P0111_08110 [Nitrospira sp.]|nr:hypothetical protein [Nitrospira sp.]
MTALLICEHFVLNSNHTYGEEVEPGHSKKIERLRTAGTVQVDTVLVPDVRNQTLYK